MKIVAIDGDRISRRLLSNVLERKGYTVLQASDGKEALRFLNSRSVKIAVIGGPVSDMDMARLVGEIRTQDGINSGQSCLIRAMSRSDKIDILTELELGVDDFVEKPYNPDILYYRIRFGEWSLDPMFENKESFNAINSLFNEHRLLRAMDNIFSIILKDLEKGVPDFVLGWATSTAFTLNFKVHEQKEEILLSTIVDKLVFQHGEGLCDIPKISFERIADEHQKLELLLFEMREIFSQCFVEKERAMATFNKDQFNLNRGELEKNNETAIIDTKEHLNTYFSRHHEFSAPLKTIISQYTGLLRAHLLLEEQHFIPFCKRYFDEEDNAKMAVEFGKIESEVGKHEIEKQSETVFQLSEILLKQEKNQGNR